MASTTTKQVKQDPIAEWNAHNPFRRASPELVRRVQQAEAAQRREAERLERAEIEDAPF